MADLRISKRDEGDDVILVLTGEIDVSTAPRLRDELNRLIHEPSGRVILDLSAVTFLDSTGLGVLVGRLKQMRIGGGELDLVVTSDRLLKNFAITGLDKVFHLFPTLDEALATR